MYLFDCLFICLIWWSIHCSINCSVHCSVDSSMNELFLTLGSSILLSRWYQHNRPRKIVGVQRTRWSRSTGSFQVCVCVCVRVCVYVCKYIYIYMYKLINSKKKNVDCIGPFWTFPLVSLSLTLRGWNSLFSLQPRALLWSFQVNWRICRGAP